MAIVDDHGGPTYQQMLVGIAVERAIHDTGRCVCGQRPTIRDRVKKVMVRLFDALNFFRSRKN